MYYFSRYLKSRLDQIVEFPMTIIEAVSGSGKSTAVHEYFLKRADGNYRQYYYTCMGEQAENTWRGICNEFSRIDHQIGQYLCAMSLPDGDAIESIAVQMRYMTCEEPTIFCIDNYQLFDMPEKDKLLQSFSLHGCENLHIIVITQPYRHKANDFFSRYPYYYISADAFYFGKDDIAAYFEQEGFRLKAGDLDTIWKTTEGYAAAVQLQMDSWRHYGHFEISAQISVLMERILWEHLQEKEKKWLFCLSMPDGFTMNEGMEICCAQYQQNDFCEFLDRIDFIRVDAGSRRYLFHHLLLEFVREKFDELPIEEQRLLWKQTAIAEEHSGNNLTAAILYGKAGDIQSFSKINFDKDDRVELIRMEDGKIVKQLIRPEYRSLLWENPELALGLTLELYVQGKIMLHMQYIEVVKEILKQPEERYGQHRGAELMGEFCLLKSFLAYNDVQEMCSYHKQAWEYMKRPTNLYSLHTAWTFGMPSVVSMFWREKGKLEQVLQEVKDGMPLYYQLSEGNGMGAHHAMEGELNLLHGNEKEALQCFQKALYDAEQLNQDSICYCAWLGIVFCKHFLAKVAKHFWRKLHLQIGESCKASADSLRSQQIRIADII